MNLQLAFKAELVLAVQLITRHRAPRLAMLLAATVVAMVLLENRSALSLDSLRRTVVLVGGVLSVVSASRLFAQGGALLSVRRTAAPWLLAPAGRLTGLLLLVSLGVFATSSLILGARRGGMEAAQCAAMVLWYCAAVAASAMALTPLTGASGSAALGVIAALFGGIPPTEVAALLENWPLLRGASVMVWNVLPLPWRAERWLTEGGLTDPLLLLFWVAFGVGATTYLAAVPGRSTPANRLT